MQHAVLDNLYNTINELVFDGVLPKANRGNFKLTVSRRLTKTLGYCGWRNGNEVLHFIKLADRIFNFHGTTPAVCTVQTLVHEMVHLYMNTVMNNLHAAHGSEWKEAYVRFSKRYDEIFKVSWMHNYAYRQVTTQYSGSGEKKSQVAADGNRKTKYVLTCPVCGYTHRCNRLGQILRRAITEDGVKHGNGCTSKLNGLQYW